MPYQAETNITINVKAVKGTVVMIIECPACSTKFSLDPRQLAEVEKPRFHCSRCSHVFTLEMNPSAVSEQNESVTATTTEKTNEDVYQEAANPSQPTIEYPDRVSAATTDEPLTAETQTSGSLAQASNSLEDNEFYDPSLLYDSEKADGEQLSLLPEGKQSGTYSSKMLDDDELGSSDWPDSSSQEFSTEINSQTTSRPSASWPSDDSRNQKEIDMTNVRRGYSFLSRPSNEENAEGSIEDNADTAVWSEPEDPWAEHEEQEPIAEDFEAENEVFKEDQQLGPLRDDTVAGDMASSDGTGSEVAQDESILDELDKDESLPTWKPSELEEPQANTGSESKSFAEVSTALQSTDSSEPGEPKDQDSLSNVYSLDNEPEPFERNSITDEQAESKAKKRSKKYEKWAT